MRRSSVEKWFTSARKGSEDKLERILNRKTAWNIDIRDAQLRSGLYIAAESGNIACVQKLLNHGADPNRQSKVGTAAHVAIEAKNAEILTLLLNYGAHIDTTNRQGQTVLECAEETFGIKRTEEILESTEHLRFDRLKKRLRKATLTDCDSSEELGVGVLAAPLPQVTIKEIKYFKPNVYANGPYSFYVKGRVCQEFVTLKMYRGDVTKDQITELFAREVRVLSELRHPNIFLLMSACYGPPLSDRCIVFEPVERGFLHRLIHVEKEPFEEDMVLEIMRDVACGLVYMHERGFLHCYLGSHSVVLNELYQAKICNFEFSQVLRYGDSSGKPISHIQALYEFMAPEQLRGKAADKLGDVYSLGVLVWECVTQRRPLRNVKNFRCIMREEDPRLKKVSGKWSANIKNLIKDCIQAAEKRPNSVQVFDWLDGLTNYRMVNTRPANMVIEHMPNLFPKEKIDLSRITRLSK